MDESKPIRLLLRHHTDHRGSLSDQARAVAGICVWLSGSGGFFPIAMGGLAQRMLTQRMLTTCVTFPKKGLASFSIGTPDGEFQMYIGGGILGTILVVLLILYLVKRI